ncbi:hypothetical protein EMPS_11271 [Entomortierella parvispora]|uniref:Late embryogenesis abundant protein LEA-2 subgroup domain-containing protein n=1 Tax=Entomortierella parvispora TaxID=205924 RepID=A0A9P3HLJ2_9FUNG|nr:hypothetical protein EMPS_11271 [Entomortierella parvispora]
MAYNNSPPATSRATKPLYSTQDSTNHISSPFDDDPVQNEYEKNQPYNNPYNPEYMPKSSYKSSSNGDYNQSSLHSTQEHALSPALSEKTLPAGAVAGTFAMQHLPTSQGNPRDTYNSDYYNQNYQGQHNPSSYYQQEPNYYNGYDEDRPSLSNDTAPMRPHSDMETSDGLTRSKSGVTRVKYQKEKSKYLPCFPCIRSTCGRFTCCICLVLLLVIIILAIVIVTVFKLPTVNYLGMQGDPLFQLGAGNTTFSVNLTAQIMVKNPNPLGFNFESIVATAYYPGFGPSLGGGTLKNVEFPAHSNRTINFPIAAAYDRQSDPHLTVINDILNKCGILGGQPATGLTLDYDLKLTIRVIFPIGIPINNQHVNFPCPANIGDIGSNIPGGLGSIVGEPGE